MLQGEKGCVKTSSTVAATRLHRSKQGVQATGPDQVQDGAQGHTHVGHSSQRARRRHWASVGLGCRGRMQARGSSGQGVPQSQWDPYKFSGPHTSASSAGASIAQEVPAERYSDFTLDSEYHCPGSSAKRQRTGTPQPQDRATLTLPAPASVGQTKGPLLPASLPEGKLRQSLLLRQGELPLPGSHLARGGAAPSAQRLVGQAALSRRLGAAADSVTGAPGAAAGSGREAAEGAPLAAPAQQAASSAGSNPHTCPELPGALSQDSGLLGPKDSCPTDKTLLARRRRLLVRRRRLLENFHRRAESELATPTAGILSATAVLLGEDCGVPQGGTGAHAKGEGAKEEGEGDGDGEGRDDLVSRAEPTVPARLSALSRRNASVSISDGSQPHAGSEMMSPPAPVSLPRLKAGDSSPTWPRRFPLPARFGIEEGATVQSPNLAGQGAGCALGMLDQKGSGEERHVPGAVLQESAAWPRQCGPFGGLSTGPMLFLDPHCPAATPDSCQQRHNHEPPSPFGLADASGLAGLGDLTGGLRTHPQAEESLFPGDRSRQSRAALSEDSGRMWQPPLPDLALVGGLPPALRSPAVKNEVVECGWPPLEGMNAQTVRMALSQLQRAEQLMLRKRASLGRPPALPRLPEGMLTTPEEAGPVELQGVVKPQGYPLYASLSASRAAAGTAATVGTTSKPANTPPDTPSLHTPSPSVGSTEGGAAVVSFSAPLPIRRCVFNRLQGSSLGASSQLDASALQAVSLLGSPQLDPPRSGPGSSHNPLLLHRQQQQQSAPSALLSHFSTQQQQQEQQPPVPVQQAPVPVQQPPVPGQQSAHSTHLSPFSAQQSTIAPQPSTLLAREATGLRGNLSLGRKIAETRRDIARLKALLQATAAPSPPISVPQPALGLRPLTSVPASGLSPAPGPGSQTSPLRPPLGGYPLTRNSARAASSSWAGRLAPSSTQSGPGLSSGAPAVHRSRSDLETRSLLGGMSVVELLGARHTWRDAKGHLRPLSVPGLRPVPSVLQGPRKVQTTTYLSSAIAPLNQSLVRGSSLSSGAGRGAGATTHSPSPGACSGSALDLARLVSSSAELEGTWLLRQRAVPPGGSEAGEGHKDVNAAASLVAAQERLLEERVAAHEERKRQDGQGVVVEGEVLGVEDYEYETEENKHEVDVLLGHTKRAHEGEI